MLQASGCDFPLCASAGRLRSGRVLAGRQGTVPVCVCVHCGMGGRFAFLEFTSRSAALTCQRNFDGWDFDKRHKVSTFMYGEVKALVDPSHASKLLPR
jgi:hypothetical protein